MSLLTLSKIVKLHACAAAAMFLFGCNLTQKSEDAIEESILAKDCTYSNNPFIAGSCRISLFQVIRSSTKPDVVRRTHCPSGTVRSVASEKCVLDPIEIPANDLKNALLDGLNSGNKNRSVENAALVDLLFKHFDESILELQLDYARFDLLKLRDRTLVFPGSPAPDLVVLTTKLNDAFNAAGRGTGVPVENAETVTIRSLAETGATMKIQWSKPLSIAQTKDDHFDDKNAKNVVVFQKGGVVGPNEFVRNAASCVVMPRGSLNNYVLPEANGSTQIEAKSEYISDHISKNSSLSNLTPNGGQVVVTDEGSSSGKFTFVAQFVDSNKKPAFDIACGYFQGFHGRVSTNNGPTTGPYFSFLPVAQENLKYFTLGDMRATLASGIENLQATR